MDSVRYPPRGNRGAAGSTRASHYGRVKNYFAQADKEICVLIQAETKDAVDQIEKMGALDGIDGIFVGPNDLSASIGHLGNRMHPDVQSLIETALKRIKATGKASGILASSEEEAQRYIDLGYTFVAVGSDYGLYTKPSMRSRSASDADRNNRIAAVFTPTLALIPPPVIMCTGGCAVPCAQSSPH